jgi:hypothetical protein
MIVSIKNKYTGKNSGMVTRIVKLPNHDNVLIGRDLGELFKNGHVYQVNQYFDTYLIVDMGETALSGHREDSPNVNSQISDIILDGTYCLTKEEFDRNSINNRSDSNERKKKKAKRTKIS